MDGSIASPALPDWVPRRALDVEAYHGMAAAGILRPDDRVELIEGELVWMAALGGPHMGAVMALTHLLLPRVPEGVRVSIQNAVRLGRHSEPQSDAALLRPRADGYRGGLPPLAEDVLLLIEVADSTLRMDREVKAPLYARHGIAEYWLVDLAGGLVLVHRDPSPEGYRSLREARPGESLVPLLLPETAPLAVSDILG
jgi:Uma2 family endonuclease